MLTLKEFVQGKIKLWLVIIIFTASTLMIGLISGFKYFNDKNKFEVLAKESLILAQSLINSKDWYSLNLYINNQVLNNNLSSITVFDDMMKPLISAENNHFFIGQYCFQKSNMSLTMNSCYMTFNKEQLSGLLLVLCIFIVISFVAIKFVFEKVNHQINALNSRIQSIITNPGSENRFKELIELQGLIISRNDTISKSAALESYAALAQNVIHDIRAPLHILKRYSSSHPDLKLSMKQLDNLIEELLPKTKLELPRLKRINMNQAFINLCEMKKAQFTDGKIELSGIDQDLFIYSNQLVLERAIGNFITNSFEAKAESVIKIELNKIGHNYEIVISDSAGGISEDHLKRILAEEKFTSKKDGNGIGFRSSIESLEALGLDVSYQNILNGFQIKIFIKKNLIMNKAPLILVDNDKYVAHEILKVAKNMNIETMYFPSIKILYENIDSIPKNAEFYIDSNLGNEKGEDAIEDLYMQGWTKINLATGYPESYFINHPCLKYVNNIVGKKFEV